MSRKHYLGKAGHLAVMAELAFRGYNVATPEIDIGDDVFAVNDNSGSLYRIQVKTGTAKEQKESYRCQYLLRVDQLSTPQTPELHYVFTTRFDNRWHFVILSRDILNHLRTVDNVGSVATNKSGKHTLTIGITFFDDGAVRSGGKDLSSYYNNWTTWPMLM